ncbi:hypothetical protein B0T21DRAFT_14759 [Apiosordaria backusii]|uniref:Uncharacterized protein n=1 Tax=Apiosordaria backusii TaxID=314023 RepID=A0AA40K7B0_9PEZI|nr:hypothetical protein B0T21DRAFT_14759 [Apiosordaria backusii]
MAAVGSTRRGRHYHVVIERSMHHVGAKLLGWLGNFPWGQSANPVLSSLLPHRSLLLRCTQAIPEQDPSPLNSIISLVHHVPPQPLIRPSSFFPLPPSQGHCLVTGVRFFNPRAPFWSSISLLTFVPFCLELPVPSLDKTRPVVCSVPFPIGLVCAPISRLHRPSHHGSHHLSRDFLLPLLTDFLHQELRVLDSQQRLLRQLGKGGSGRVKRPCRATLR